MCEALGRHCGEVVPLGPVPPDLTLYLGKVRNQLSQRLLGKKYDYAFSRLLSQHYARFFEARLARAHFDWIFAPAASTEIAYLETRLPLVYYSDSTFALLRGYYPDFTNLTNAAEAASLERRATARADLLIYPSQWAAASAHKHYEANLEKIAVIPFGANLEEVPTREQALQHSLGDRCRLLFLAVDWRRKGGEIAFETLVELEKLGIRAELTVCGCPPPPTITHPRLRVIPFINKNDPAGSHQLMHLLLEAHFLLLPTRADCTPIVLSEAAAAGLPVLVANTGGVGGAVTDGENGFLLPYEARGEAYARKIRGVYSDPECYRRLVHTSRQAFEARLNWDAWAVALGARIRQRGLLPL